MTGSGAAPQVSLVVPVYNVVGHVAACIAALRAQTFSDFEAIVVDDGSTDGSDAALRAAIGGDPRFKVIRQDNAGLSAARNAGLAQVRAPVIGFVDSDDRVAPDYLEVLYATLEDTGADWVSCGITFCHAEGRNQTHSGMHDPGKLDDTAPPERHDLTNWCDVVRHFPSAWNKLYRASLIAGLRFDEGQLYEDHAFYWQAAARTDHLVRVSRPLYLQTQGRAGQITGKSTDEIFQQFDVLDRLAGLAEGLERPGVEAALAQIATRLTFERCVPVTDRARRARFIARARDWLAARGLAADLALAVPIWWADLLAGQVPVSVVVPSNGAPAPLSETLTSLAARTLPEAEVIVTPDETALEVPACAGLYAQAAETGVSVLAGPQGVHGARNRGLDAARGRYVVFLDAGDRLPPGALANWAARLGRAGAAMGFAGMRMGPQGTPHSGLHDSSAPLTAHLEAEAGFAPTLADGIDLHGHPSAKMFDVAFLQREGLRFAPGPLSSSLLVMAVMARAPRAVHLPYFTPRIATRPECRTQWRAACDARSLWQAVNGAGQDLTPAQQGRLWARLVWEKINYADFPGPAARAAFEAEVQALSAQIEGLAEAPLDPFIGARVRALLGR